MSHPVGNIKIKIIKFSAEYLNKFLIFFLSFFIKIDKKRSEIIISNAILAPWKFDDKFQHIYKKIRSKTILDVRRLYTLWYYAKLLSHKKAAVLDLGCLLGGAGFLLSYANKSGNVYLIDTFEGYVDKSKFFKTGVFDYASVNEVEENIYHLKLRNTFVIKTNFPHIKNKIKYFDKIKMCHIDMNTYESTKKSFFFIHDKIIKGGVVVFDDYGTYGADKIVAFVNKIEKKYKKFYNFFYNYQGQCVLIRK
jgi:SAM-dependent methyltransferase